MKKVIIVFFVVGIISCASKTNTEIMDSKKAVKKVDRISLSKRNIDAKKNIELKFRLISSGSAQSVFSTTVIRNESDLKLFYKSYFNRAENLPEIDFSKEALVAVSGGECSTGGYSVELISSKSQGMDIFLEFDLKSPAPTQLVTQAFTKPYTIICVEAKPEQNIKVGFKGSDIKSSKIR